MAPPPFHPFFPFIGMGLMVEEPNSQIRGMYLLACIVGGMVVGGVGVIFWKGTRYLVG